MKIFPAFATAAALVFAAGQAAGQPAEPRSAVVSYADLDLARDSGRTALERRIALAVKEVCPGRPLVTEIHQLQMHKDCRKTAWSGARQQLAALYERRLLADGGIRVSSGR